MSVYYFVRVAVAINYVNKSNNNSQTRNEQNMQKIYSDLLLHVFGFCCFHLGGKVEVKPKYYWDRKILDMITIFLKETPFVLS